MASNAWAFVKSDKVYQDLKNFMMQSTSVCIASLVLVLFFSCQGAKFLNCESNWGLPVIQRKMQVNKRLSEISSICLDAVGEGFGKLQPMAQIWPTAYFCK